MTDTDDGLADLLVDDIDLDTNFVWQPKAQPGPTVSNDSNLAAFHRKWISELAHTPTT